MPFDLEQLRTLASLARSGTFEAAARELSVTPSAVSQRIKNLEQAAGSILIERSKPVRVTAPGEVLLGLARRFDLLEQEALRALGSTSAPVNLAIVANADSLDTWLLPALATVEGVTFDIHREDQEHSTDLLRAGTVLGAVTSNPEAVQGCSVSRIGSMTYRPTASPAFLERWMPHGATAQSLATAPVAVFDRKDDLQYAYLRSRGVEPGVPPRSFVPGSAAFVRAVRLGFGWGMLPDLQIAELVASGELAVFDNAGAVEVPLYWQHWSLESEVLRAVSVALRSADLDAV